uniref:Uncharacterized protein n=1 Tax=Alexandrium andersonii TaxID=327968 RepID=A0A7S2ACM5_9DINO|mmetsp:Transcript_100379/g.224949  ORF Transcript_100379/g.224949 Transcript_100379/m.224949 type:complete len:102 (+) Transcript_100379:79-384(+)
MQRLFSLALVFSLAAEAAAIRARAAEKHEPHGVPYACRPKCAPCKDTCYQDCLDFLSGWDTVTRAECLSCTAAGNGGCTMEVAQTCVDCVMDFIKHPPSTP